MNDLINLFISKSYFTIFTVWYILYWLWAYIFIYEGSRGGYFLPIYALWDDLSLQFPGNKGKRILETSTGNITYCFSEIEGSYTALELQADKKLCDKIGNKMYPGLIYCLVITAPIMYPFYIYACKMLGYVNSAEIFSRFF